MEESLRSFSNANLKNEIELNSLGKTEFRDSQQKDKALKWIRESAEKGRTSYELRNGFIFRITMDHYGGRGKQLVVLSQYRREIL